MYWQYLYTHMVLDPKMLKRLPKKNLEEAQSVLANVKKYLKECISEARQFSKRESIIRKEK